MASCHQTCRSTAWLEHYSNSCTIQNSLHNFKFFTALCMILERGNIISCIGVAIITEASTACGLIKEVKPLQFHYEICVGFAWDKIPQNSFYEHSSNFTKCELTDASLLKFPVCKLSWKKRSVVFNDSSASHSLHFSEIILSAVGSKIEIFVISLFKRILIKVLMWGGGLFIFSCGKQYLT